MAFVLRQLAKPTLQRNLLVSTSSLRYAAKDAASKSPTTIAPSMTNPQQQLIVSDSCLKRLREICLDGSFLRITVEGGGCSGFQYKFDLDTKMNEDDLQFGEEKAKVVIDTISLDYCSGATIDYHSELIRAGFRMVANPQAEMGCSCGSSFAIKL
ncbi:iron-sulfur cluster assembly 2 homolog, mitochondrial isoform X1 [Drosophila nasuta]|uniref:iron-sulfur cluster assembly 2 homolog, mitochondrial isoform X1 n=1 Tax=Drosophila nasuta TaxID=42062 RepID=UPI00295E6F9D|nr:iron-sulfur cluster assembly 2 homolog, mitochondrial isoform X1 [Drosophila nasuta]